jgi:hypothetical protein
MGRAARSQHAEGCAHSLVGNWFLVTERDLQIRTRLFEHLLHGDEWSVQGYATVRSGSGAGVVGLFVSHPHGGAILFILSSWFSWAGCKRRGPRPATDQQRAPSAVDQKSDVTML